MRHIACLILTTLSVVPSLAAAPPLPTAPTPDEANTPLISVSKRESYVFASMPTGLFRAALETKKWEQLKTPPGMPPAGRFAAQPGKSPLVIYVATPPADGRRPGARYGLYFSHDDGASWQLVSERADYGATLLHPSGALFAVTGAVDEVIRGDHILRSPDLGKTWRDITGNAFGMIERIEPDPYHQGLVRIHAFALRVFSLSANDENYHWNLQGEPVHRRRHADEFFSRNAASSTGFCWYRATLANYFQYDFGNRADVPALEVVVPRARFEFERGARVVVPVQIVFHYDPACALAEWRKSAARGRPYPKPTPPSVKLADRPEGTEFWGIRVESTEDQIEKYPRALHAAVEYRVVDLSPSAPYGREIDLSRLASFPRPGEYHVQFIYSSGRVTNCNKDVWNGLFTSPVFTVVIREAK